MEIGYTDKIYVASLFLYITNRNKVNESVFSDEGIIAQ